MPAPHKSLLATDEWLGSIDTSALLPEDQPVRMARLALLILSGTLFLLLGWAGIASLKEVTAAYGQVLPTGHVQIVQHLEGGIVREILVNENDLVEEGQPLVRIESAEAESNLNQAKYQRLALLMDAERTSAQIENRPADFSRFGLTGKDLVSQQKKTLESNREARLKEREVIEAQIAQRRDTLKSLESRYQTLTENLLLLTEEFEMKRRLFEKGYYSRANFLEKQRQVNEMTGEITVNETEIARTHGEISEYESRLNTLATTQAEQAHQELTRLQAEIAKIDESIARFSDRVERLEVVAPSRGIVKGIEVNTIGGVLTPGQKLMEIVPLGEELKVEARIRPSDVGQIRPGQPVKVKVHAFDYTRFGVIEGRLESISATTFIDQSNSTFFKGVVQLDKQYAGDTPGKNLLVPGMTVDTEIITGERTLLAYLLKPIRNAADTAFTEK